MYKIYELILENENISLEDKKIIRNFLECFTKKEINQEEEEINNQFTSILNNIEDKDFIDAFNHNIVEIVKQYLVLEDKSELFTGILQAHKDIFDYSKDNKKQVKQFNDMTKMIKNRTNKYNAYTKNTDFIITKAFIETLQSFPELVKDKTIKLNQRIGFSDGSDNNYTIELLSKDELLNGIPMFLGGITPCCLNFGATGGNFSLYSILDPNANFAVVKHNEKVISHALIWLDKDEKTLVIDSIDPTKQLAIEGNNILSEQHGNLLAYLYNDLARQLLVDNPALEQVNMSLGGNTLEALKFNDTSEIKDETFYEGLLEEISKYTSWGNELLVNPAVPKNGEAFSMNDFSIHENTYNYQVPMLKQNNLIIENSLKNQDTFLKDSFYINEEVNEYQIKMENSCI